MSKGRTFVAGLVVAQVTLIFFASAATALASHSASSPRYFFDFNNNGIAEASDSFVVFQKRGPEWTSTKEARAAEAASSWANNTDFNPSLTWGPQVQDLWIDGSEPVSHGDCSGGADTWFELGDGDPSFLYGVTCRVTQDKGSYFRMVDSNIYLNSDNKTLSWAVHISSNGWPSARGVLTHEIGHAARLVHANPCGGATMCGSASDQSTWDLWSLTSDDIASANLMYLP